MTQWIDSLPCLFRCPFFSIQQRLPSTSLSTGQALAHAAGCALATSRIKDQLGQNQAPDDETC